MENAQSDAGALPCIALQKGGVLFTSDKSSSASGVMTS